MPYPLSPMSCVEASGCKGSCSATLVLHVEERGKMSSLSLRLCPGPVPSSVLLPCSHLPAAERVSFIIISVPPFLTPRQISTDDWTRFCFFPAFEKQLRRTRPDKMTRSVIYDIRSETLAESRRNSAHFLTSHQVPTDYHVISVTLVIFDDI